MGSLWILIYSSVDSNNIQFVIIQYISYLSKYTRLLLIICYSKYLYLEYARMYGYYSADAITRVEGCGSGRMGRGPSSRGVVLVEWGVVNFQLGVWPNRVIMIIMISLNKFKDLRTSRDMSCTTCTLYEVYTVQCTLQYSDCTLYSVLCTIVINLQCVETTERLNIK